MAEKLVRGLLGSVLMFAGCGADGSGATNATAGATATGGATNTSAGTSATATGGTNATTTGTGGTITTSSGGMAATAGEGGTNACAALEACQSSMSGGRGNVCGGVVADSRVLLGTGFELWEGAPVVGEFGYTHIEDGRFSLPAGYYAGCPMKPTRYRIDVSANGRCDGDVDLVYVYEPSEGTPGPIGAVDGANPGEVSSCAVFTERYDLELGVARDCLPRCGSLDVSLFDEGQVRLAETRIFLDGPPLTGHGFAGLLTPGRGYRLRYSWDPSPFGGACSPSAVWEHAFVATADRSSVELSLSTSATRATCN